MPKNSPNTVATWSTANLQTVADILPGLIAVYNIKTGQYLYVNRASTDLLGYSPEVLLSKGAPFVTSLVHPEDLPRIMQQNQAALEAANATGPNSRGLTATFEYRMRHRDGSWIWLQTTGSIFDRSADGTVAHVLNISVDITTAKEAETKLVELNEQLMALNTAKDEFIAIASHQLRTPATSVKQYLGMLLDKYAGTLEPEQQTYAAVAYENNERLLTIINNLLTVARIDAGAVQLRAARHNLTELAQTVTAQQLPSLKLRKQRVVVQLPTHPLHVHVDKNLLNMVLETTIDNASKYSPDGTEITIVVKRVGPHVVLQIRDQGVGITAKDRPKLFQKFSRVQNQLSTPAGGTGLSLYWAKKIITLHGGTITLHSKPNQGTTVTIKLPAHKKAT